MDVRELIAIMKDAHALRVKMGGLEVELAPSAFTRAPEASAAPDNAKQQIPAMPENFLLYSVQDQSPMVTYEAPRREGEETES